MTFEPFTSDRRRQQTRDYLLQAAAQVFAARGFHAATLDEVAAAAGYTKGAVYSNFKNKEDLFLALLEATYSRELSELRDLLHSSEVSPVDRLGEFVGLVKNESGSIPHNWGALYLEFGLYAMRHPAARQRLNELDRADIQAVAEIIRGQDGDQDSESSARAQSTARLVTALFRGIGLMQALDPEFDNAEILEDAMSFVVRALDAGP
jgi:AcrR family transcriptional regulator